MINTNEAGAAPEGREAEIDGIVNAGARGAVALAGIATAVVIGLWLAFYLLVFMPRGGP